MLSTRRGIVMVASLAAVLGGAILLAFLSNYRSSLNGPDGNVQVVVATRLIEKGSPADAIAADRSYQITSIRKADVKDGAITDPDKLKSHVTTRTIYPGEQIRSSDFRKQGNSLGDQIRGRERAISLPFTPYGGLVGDLQTGDHVDVIAGFRVQPQQQQPAAGRDVQVVRTILQDALVLKVPEETDAGAAGAARKQPVVLVTGSR